jgi:hypothetical protein
LITNIFILCKEGIMKGAIRRWGDGGIERGRDKEIG